MNQTNEYYNLVVDLENDLAVLADSVCERDWESIDAFIEQYGDALKKLIAKMDEAE